MINIKLTFCIVVFSTIRDAHGDNILFTVIDKRRMTYLLVPFTHETGDRVFERRHKKITMVIFIIATKRTLLTISK